MKIKKALSRDILIVGIIAVIFFGIYVFAGYLFTHRLEGEAQRINLAGQLRLRSYRMAQIVEIALMSKERGPIIEKLKKEMEEFERIAENVKSGNKEMGLKPIGNERLKADIDRIIERWNKEFKPFLLEVINSPDLFATDKLNQSLMEYRIKVDGYVDEINEFVKAIAIEQDKAIAGFDRIRLIILLSFSIFAALSTLYFLKNIVKPLTILKKAIREIGDGRLDVKIAVKGSYELEELSMALENMASNLKDSIEEIKEHLKEIVTLSEASTSIISITEPEVLYKEICNIVRNLFNFKMIWLGLVEEGSFEIKPVAYAGVDEEEVKKVKVTWDDSPTGMGPSGMAIKKKEPVIMSIDDPYFDRWREIAREMGHNYFAGIPLIGLEGKCIGVFTIASERNIHHHSIRLLQIFANQSAIAIENARLIKNLEERVRERTSELELAKLIAESANRAKSDFLANMSHELRTPLTSIMGFSEVIYDELFGPLNEKQKEYMNLILTSANHLLNLINDILDLSKVEAGRMELELSKFLVKDLLHSSLAMVKEKALKHKISLRLDIEPDAEIEMEADERKLKQIMFNLLSNAVKFTPDGGSVVVRARRIGYEKIKNLGINSIPEKDFLEISVEDTGIGIKAEDIPNLFSEFSQLDSPYQKKYQGTGLGLALTKKLVELHKGRIWCESEYGRGSKFTFIIPI